MGVRTTKTCTFERERVIFGEDFDDFLHFFVELLSYCAKPKGNDQFLVAFVTRRCHILLQEWFPAHPYILPCHKNKGCTR